MIFDTALNQYILGRPVKWSEFSSFDKRWTLFCIDFIDSNRDIDVEYDGWVVSKYLEAAENAGKIRRRIST